MATILQVIDNDSTHTTARLSDGRVVRIPHPVDVHIGAEFEEAAPEAVSEATNAVDTERQPEAPEEGEHSEEKAPVE